MQYEIYNAKTYERLGTEEAEPTHDDKCNRCGECLRCCGPQDCAAAIRENDPPFHHQWIVEVEPDEEPRSALAYEYP